MSSLLSKLRDFLLGEQPPALRNRPGGLARIRRYGPEYGADVLAGWIVTTERADGCFWTCSPIPVYQLTSTVRFHGGDVRLAGTWVQVVGMPDELLDPIPDTGITKEEVADLFAPSKTKEGHTA